MSVVDAKPLAIRSSSFVDLLLSFQDALQTAKPAEVQTRNPEMVDHLGIPGSLAADAARAPE
jgi:hypothetical protein